MSTILVEARRDPHCGPILDRLAAAAADLGHDVRRWRGPISRRVPYSRRLVRCDVAILFNGAHPTYQKPREQLRRMGAQVLFVELGWYPQTGTFQVDHEGINAAASWAGQPLTGKGQSRLTLRPAGELLVVLQDDADTQITDHSPWLADMHDFLQHLARYSQLPLRVRPHPRHPPSTRLTQLVARAGLRWDRSQSMRDALATCRAVACVNSSAAVEALAQRLPVLCFGRAIYRHEGAVYCLDDDGLRTRRVTTALAAGECELYRELVEEVVDRIVARQWTIDDIPDKLPAVLASLPGGQSAAARPPWRGWMSRRAG